MNIYIYNNYDEVSINAAKQIINLVKSKPNCTLGLATGSSVIGIYEQIAKDFEKNKTSYKAVTTFNLDEYYGLPKEHSQSYFTFMCKHLFKHIDIDLNNVHIPCGNAKDTTIECNLYNHLLQESKIDLQLLGIGTDGHIGFNEPGTDFNLQTHCVNLLNITRQDNARFFNSINEVPTQAITVGIKNILSAKKIILVAMGNSKAAAVKQMIEGKVTTDCPASALQTHPNVYIYLDKAAAKLLK